MGSDLSAGAKRVLRGLLAGKSLNDLAPPGDPLHEEVSAHLTRVLEGKPSRAASGASAGRKPRAAAASAASPPPAPPRSTLRGAAVAYSDGASRGNPGPAAYGIRIVDADGGELHASGAKIGRATNNVAEYRGAIAALEIARDLGVRRLELRMDSELVVKQLRGEYRVKDANLAALKTRLDRLIRDFEAFRVSHVRRGENSETDRLANEALDGE